MSEDDFEQQKAALKSNKLSRDRALADESTRHWDTIWNERLVYRHTGVHKHIGVYRCVCEVSVTCKEACGIC